MSNKIKDNTEVMDNTTYNYVLTRSDWINAIKCKDGTVVRYIDILGIRYKIIVTSAYDAFPKLKCGMDAYTDKTTKEIVVDSFKYGVNDKESVGNLYKYICDLIRHEVVHSFLRESGLDVCCNWATEEMVDWVAIQLPKFFNALSNIKEE